MKTLDKNYYGASGQNGTSGGSGGPGVYGLNIGGAKTGGGYYLPPGNYATGASVEIEGGAGGYGDTGITSYNGGTGGNGGAGGMGVLLGGGTLGNSGTILGGAGGHGGYGYFDGTSSVGSPGGTGGAGGVGVEFTSAAKLINHSGGKITGGVGGVGGDGGLYGGLGGVGGSGGVGVILGNGTLTNAATITGGVGGAGGYGGSPPEGTGQGGTGDGGAGGGGAAGVTLVGGVLTNTAAITGGAGGQGGYGEGALGNGGAGAAGGSGAYLLGGTLTNHSSITGGVGGVGGGGYHGGVGGSGGTGVLLKGGTVLTTGNISGGTGGAAGNGVLAGIGGAGGAGVTELSGALTNLGSITGGVGGVGGGKFFGGAAGGSGGAGVLLGGGTLTNSGIISGGHGGTGGLGYSGNQFGYPPAPGGPGGNGGAGVYLNGGTLTTSGTISGGAGGAGGTGVPNGAAGAAGDAVQFGSAASTLVVEPGAVFNGQVAANASVNDTLRLSGTQSGGTPITLGSQFTNFSTVAFVSGAAWTVDVGSGAAPSGGLTITGFTTPDTIDVTNLTPSQVQADFTTGSHTLATTSDGTLHFVSGPFSGDAFLFSNDGSGGTDMTLVVGAAISLMLTSSVVLGSTAHESPLTISNAGEVAPSTAGTTGVLSDLSGNSLTNNGAIKGSTGSSSSVGGTGGVGVNFKLGSTVMNAGSISGGNGGSGNAGAGGVGGAGVNLLTGTLTNTGSIAGGAGGTGTTSGGDGGAGVFLNGGTLITVGSISGGPGGSGTPNGAAGDAVKFGTGASTLIVDPGAVFNGQVVALNSHDVLELAGTQSGGTPITLGTQFTFFSTLDFASGADWTVDAVKAGLTSHPLSVDGFASGDKLDITNLAASGSTLSFNTTSHLLTITSGATTIDLQFDSAFSGKHFVLSADGHGGSDLHLLAGASSTLDASGQDVMNFVSDEHRAMIGKQTTAMFGSHSAGSGLTHAVEPDPSAWSHGLAVNAFNDHGIAHASVMLR